ERAGYIVVASLREALFGIGVDTKDVGDWLLRGLAVLGAAALGGFLAGLILQVAAKLLAAQKVPRQLLQVARAIGAVTVGVLVAFILFHGAGGGGGSGLGDGFGLGGGKDEGGKQKDERVEKDAKVVKDEVSKDGGAEKPGAVLTVEVLGDDRA